MNYVYVLLSKIDKRFYIGATNSIERRVRQHQDGTATSTRSRRPLELLYYEAHQNKLDALRRERYFKTAKGKSTLRQMLRLALSDADRRLNPERTTK